MSIVKFACADWVRVLVAKRKKAYLCISQIKVLRRCIVGLNVRLNMRKKLVKANW